MSPSVASTAASPITSAAATASKNFFNTVNFRQRIICHFDELCLKPTDMSTVTSIVKSKNISIVSFLLPSQKLQELVHPRYEVEDIAFDKVTGAPHGLLTVVASEFSLKNQSKRTMFERLFEPEWVGQLVLKTSVVDRHNWNRTAWHFRSYLQSRQWQDFPQKVYGLDLRSAKMNVDASFNEEKNVFDNYRATCKSIGFDMELEDTGVSVLDPETRTVDGFVDNESALRVVTMHRESLMRGMEGTCFRSGVWSTPVIPNVAKIKSMSIGREICDLFDLAEDQVPIESPLCSWIVKDIPQSLVYQAESMIEDENEPNDYTDQNEKTYTERAQKRAMNRFHDMQQEVRKKAYRDAGYNKVGMKFFS